MDIQTILRQANLKSTIPRVELLSLFLKIKKPICYDDIKKDITMDKATFYRNISKFLELNIVQGFESNNNKRYFAIEANLHPHFICNYCNKIECINDFKQLTLKNHTIENVIFKGKCQKCASY